MLPEWPSCWLSYLNPSRDTRSIDCARPGLTAIANAHLQIAGGEAEVVVAGGVESMFARTVGERSANKTIFRTDRGSRQCIRLEVH